MTILIILVRLVGCLDFLIAFLSLVGYAYVNISIPTFTPLSGVSGQIVMLIIWSYFSAVCLFGLTRAFAAVRLVLSTKKETTSDADCAKMWLVLSTLGFLLDTGVLAWFLQLQPLKATGMWVTFGFLEVTRIAVLCIGFRYLWTIDKSSEPQLEQAKYTEDHDSFHI